MKTRAILLVLAVASACSRSEAPDPEPPTTTPPPSQVPRVEQVYVQASSLRLRPEPRGDTDSFTTLAINSRLRVLERSEGWLSVVAVDGRDGWVHADYVEDQPLTLQAVQQAIAGARDDQEKLALWQRAAALEPTDAAVLASLAGAYRTVGMDAEAARVEAFSAEGLALFDAWFPAQAAEVEAIGAAFAEAGSADALVAAWQRALAATEAMAEPLNAHYDDMNLGFGDVDVDAMIARRMPWAQLDYYAEGTWAALELPEEAWSQAARRTPDPWDDDFFALLAAAYHNVSGRGWAAWQAREWDYGGCSPFGNGQQLHLDLLRRCDALAERAPVAQRVATLRADVLQDIEQPHGPGEFPYCLHMGKSTPLEGLRSEAKAILEGVTLSEAERAMIERRSKEGFEPRGG